MRPLLAEGIQHKGSVIIEPDDGEHQMTRAASSSPTTVTASGHTNLGKDHPRRWVIPNDEEFNSVVDSHAPGVSMTDGARETKRVKVDHKIRGPSNSTPPKAILSHAKHCSGVPYDSFKTTLFHPLCFQNCGDVANNHSFYRPTKVLEKRRQQLRQQPDKVQRQRKQRLLLLKMKDEMGRPSRESSPKEVDHNTGCDIRTLWTPRLALKQKLNHPPRDGVDISCPPIMHYVHQPPSTTAAAPSAFTKDTNVSDRKKMESGSGEVMERTIYETALILSADLPNMSVSNM